MRNLTDEDLIEECPICGGNMKQTDNPDYIKADWDKVAPYACVGCGYLALFQSKPLEAYIKRKLEI